MDKRTSIFEETLSDYLRQLKEADWRGKAMGLGLAVGEGEVLIPLLGRYYRLTLEGVWGPEGEKPGHAVQVLLCRYILLAPEVPPRGEEWVSYKDFPDAAPFVGGFINNTERALVKRFAGRAQALTEACRSLGGIHPQMELAYQLVFLFEALPHLPLLLLFNDQDEEFPAQALILFQKRASRYLDMECLAILGWFLTDNLLQADGARQATIM